MNYDIIRKRVDDVLPNGFDRYKHFSCSRKFTRLRNGTNKYKTRPRTKDFEEPYSGFYELYRVIIKENKKKIYNNTIYRLIMTDLNKLEEICEKYGNSKEVKEAVKEAFIFKENEFDKYHRPVWDVEDYDVYKRHLIQLRPDTAILLHIFERDIDKNFETIWLDDNEKYYEADFKCIKDSAHQFLLQLEGHYCDAFIEALRDECNEILKNSEERKAKIKYKEK